MKAKACTTVVTTIAVASFTASMAFAGIFGGHHSSQKSTSMDITETTQVPGGPTLQPGTYKVTLIGASSKPEVEFYREGKLVGQVPVTLVDQGQKIEQTEIDSTRQANGTYVMNELDLSGLTQKVMFKTSKASGG